MTVPGGLGSLLCPMLIWVYYISIDFLPCTPAIDTWIYHVNCSSTLGQEFIWRSVWHQEEDKETVSDSSLVSHRSCTSLSFQESNFLYAKTLKVLKADLLVGYFGSEDMISFHSYWDVRLMTKQSSTDLYSQWVFFLMLAAVFRFMVFLLSLFIPLTLIHPSLTFTHQVLMRAGSTDSCEIELIVPPSPPFLFPLILLWHAKVLMIMNLGSIPNDKHLIEKNEKDSGTKRSTKQRKEGHAGSSPSSLSSTCSMGNVGNFH